MTVRVTTLKGAEAGCYYVERLPRYYLDANEPRGRWVGTAAVDLGLAGRSSRSANVSRPVDPTNSQRELAALLATDLGVDATAIIDAVESLADWITMHRCVDISAPVAPDALLRADGRPVSESAVDRALTTQAILDQEHDLLDWAERRLDAGDDVEPAAIDRSDVDLNIAQADAASRLAGDEQLVLIVGPAGTGKTTALRPAVAQLRADGRPVFGVAPSETEDNPGGPPRPQALYWAGGRRDHARGQARGQRRSALVL